MPRQDDSALVGDIRVFRRIPPKADRVSKDENGNLVPSTQNFRDSRDDELSMYIAAETSEEAVLRGCEDFYLIEMTIGQIRAVYTKYKRDLAICRDVTEETGPGHILVCGKPSPSMKDELRECAKWVPGRGPMDQPLPPQLAAAT